MYLAIRPPALSRVQCGVLTRSCELRATVTRTMPSFDPSPMESGDRRNRCTCAVVCRYFAVELHCLRAAAILFISSKKRKGARKTFTCAIYVRGARRQRYSEDWASVGADTWRLVSVGCPTDATRRREAGCTDTLLVHHETSRILELFKRSMMTFFIKKYWWSLFLDWYWGSLIDSERQYAGQ